MWNNNLHPVSSVFIQFLYPVFFFLGKLLCLINVVSNPKRYSVQSDKCIKLLVHWDLSYSIINSYYGKPKLEVLLRFSIKTNLRLINQSGSWTSCELPDPLNAHWVERLVWPRLEEKQKKSMFSLSSLIDSYIFGRDIESFSWMWKRMIWARNSSINLEQNYDRRRRCHDRKVWKRYRDLSCM